MTVAISIRVRVARGRVLLETEGRAPRIVGTIEHCPRCGAASFGRRS